MSRTDGRHDDPLKYIILEVEVMVEIEKLTGGNMNIVYKEGNNVVRSQGVGKPPFSAIHFLLETL